MSYRLTRLGYGLVDALIKCQISYDAHNVPLNLQGVSAKLINPLEERQASTGNYMVTVALDLHTRCIKVSSEHVFTLTKNQKDTNLHSSLSKSVTILFS